MKFETGLFVQLVDRYDHDTGTYHKELHFVNKDWVTEDGLLYYKREGLVLVKKVEYEVDVEHVTQEMVVAGMVEGLKERQQMLRAEAEKSINELQKQINDLMLLPSPNDDTDPEWV